MIHDLPATPATCFWGFFHATLPAAVRHDADLNRAMKAAARGLLSFLVEQRGLSRDDAYSLISVAGDFGVPLVVDQRQGCTA